MLWSPARCYPGASAGIAETRRAAGKGLGNRAATAGTTGHEKARRQRQILGEAKPRLKTRKEITKALEGTTGDYAAALRWVLGEAV
jgi:hypothetical protein